MNHEDHVRLIAGGVGSGSGGHWADFGAGDGAFTLALRDVAGSDVAITAVDRDRASLRRLSDAMERRFPGTRFHSRVADFTRPLDVPPLDGIVAANAIHFVPSREQTALLQQWREYLLPEGRLVVVEYDADRGNTWVPYPLSFARFQTLAEDAGFRAPVLLTTVPSRFLGSMYAAVARV